jgi:RNA polymerase sigma-70 factor (ECF subfamily)
LDALYDRYNRLVFSVALNAVGDRATAEEITLDVFTRVWEKAATYQAERAQVNTWLTSIARHRAIDVLRRWRVRPEQHSVEWAEVSAADTPNVSGPEAAVERRLQRASVRRALAALPEEQRQAIALAYFQGLSHSEIAEAVNAPLGTVKTRVRLGMQKLRQMLADT